MRGAAARHHTPMCADAHIVLEIGGCEEAVVMPDEDFEESFSDIRERKTVCKK